MSESLRINIKETIRSDQAAFQDVVRRALRGYDMQKIIVFLNNFLSLIMLEVYFPQIFVNLEDCPSEVRSDSLLLPNDIQLICILLAVREHISSEGVEMNICVLPHSILSKCLFR